MGTKALSTDWVVMKKGACVEHLAWPPVHRRRLSSALSFLFLPGLLCTIVLLCCSMGGYGRGWGDPCWKRKLRHTPETHPPFSDFSFFLERVCGQGTNRPVREPADGKERQANVATDATNRGGQGKALVCVCVCARVCPCICAPVRVHACVCVRLRETSRGSCLWLPPMPLKLPSFNSTRQQHGFPPGCLAII